MLPLLPHRMLSIRPLSLLLLALSSNPTTDNSLCSTLPITPPVLANLHLHRSLPSHLP